jgi:hypothetical protein
VLWRKNIEGLKSCDDVENGQHVKRRYPDDIEFASSQDSHLLSEIYYHFGYSSRGEILVNSPIVNWIFDRTMAHLITSHYKSWLNLSQQLINDKRIPRYRPFLYENVPFFVIIIPNNENDTAEFHWWLNKEGESKKTLECPFPHLKEKRRLKSLFKSSIDQHFNLSF